MPMKLASYFKYGILFFLGTMFLTACQQPQPVKWPKQTNETKPWTRLWWHGSAVNTGELTSNMQELEAAGFGGV